MSSNNPVEMASPSPTLLSDAVQLARSRGVFQAAALLRERGVTLEAALQLLAHQPNTHRTTTAPAR